jgi:ABC-2 type transport system permease protein
MALWNLFRREFGTYFASPLAYITLVAFALIQGLQFTFWLTFMDRSNVKDVSIFQFYFAGIFFWFIMLLQTPLLTMRSISEEYKLGTIEMLLTSPVQEWEIVVSKYLGSLSFFLFLWSPTFLNLLLLKLVSGGQFQIYWGTTLMPYLGLTLIGMLYLSVGIFCSALTKNQIVAAILCFVLVFLIWGLGLVGPYLGLGADGDRIVGYFSALSQMDNFTKGIFDTRPVVFYGTFTVLFLFLTQRILQARRLRG